MDSRFAEKLWKKELIPGFEELHISAKCVPKINLGESHSVGLNGNCSKMFRFTEYVLLFSVFQLEQMCIRIVSTSFVSRDVSM